MKFLTKNIKFSYYYHEKLFDTLFVEFLNPGDLPHVQV